MLGDYTGTVVHDGWAPYESMTGATHAQCGVHLIRHLKSVGRTSEFAEWCAEMIDVLVAVKDASETAAAKGRSRVAPAKAKALRDRYGSVLDDAFGLLPEGPSLASEDTAAGTKRSARRGTWPPACASSKIRSFERSMTRRCPRITTRRNGRCEW